MALYEKWQALTNIERSEKEETKFWEEYLALERDVYQKILADNTTVLTGKLSDLAQNYEMDTTTFSGFLDGINTSLTKELDLNSLNEETQLDIQIDYEKLYFNMLGANAEWLYELKEWDPIFTQEKRSDIKKAYNKSRIVVNETKIGRNDPCPCGSGKKYKQCCLNK